MSNGTAIIVGQRMEHEPMSPLGNQRCRPDNKVQRALVVRLEGNSSKTINVIMEKKNPRISQPIACRPLRLAML